MQAASPQRVYFRSRLVSVDFDGASFGLLDFRQRQGENAIVIAGLHAISINGRRQCEGLLKLAGLEVIPVCSCSLGRLHLAFPFHVDRILSNGDFYVLWLDAR